MPRGRSLGEVVRIGGLQKTSLLDFPGKVSAVVFTQGCNFLCPYCHNPNLVLCRQEALALALADVLAFLAQRRRVLEGVVVSGGEPTLHDGLFSFCATLKSLGYAVKLDTNGSRPETLRLLLEAKLLDYVAMDVKGDPRRYPEALGAPEGDTVARAMGVLRQSDIAHEFRIPCAAPFIDEAGFSAILEEAGDTPLFLQAVRLENVLRPDFFATTGRPLDAGEMETLRATALRGGADCRIR